MATDATTSASNNTINESVKMNAALVYGQGTQVYPPKAGGVYKGDITIIENHVLQEIGKNSVIAHDKSRLNYVSEEFRQTAEKLRRPDVAIYYQDKQGKSTENATVFPFSRAKDDMERVVAGLKKSAKELGMPDMDKSLDALAERSWARNQDIRQNIKAEKAAAKDAKTVENKPETKQEPRPSAKR